MFGSWLDALLVHPILSADDEARLIAQAQAGDTHARDELVRCNARFIAKIVARWTPSGVDAEDLYQEGAMGLVAAIERFDPSRGHRLLTYAVHWITQGIRRFAESTGATIRIPEHAQRKARRLAADPDCDDGHWRETLGGAARVVRSLDAPFEAGGDMHGLVEGDWSPPDVEILVAQIIECDRLTGRERHVLRALFLEERPITTVATALGVTRQRVEQVRDVALAAIRDWMAHRETTPRGVQLSLPLLAPARTDEAGDEEEMCA